MLRKNYALTTFIKKYRPFDERRKNAMEITDLLKTGKIYQHGGQVDMYNKCFSMS